MTTLATAPVPAPRSRLRRMHYEPEPGTDGPPPPMRLVPPPVAEVFDELDRDAVQKHLTRVLRLAMEVFDGRRPSAQLAPHFATRTLRYWRVATAQRQARTPARVDRIIAGFPRPGAVELAAVCAIDGRVRALAARFEQTAPTQRWRCTDLRLG